MSKSKKSVLLVEGWADKSFFEHLMRKTKIDASVKVTNPKEFGGHHDTKGGVLNALPTLLRQMNDGSLERVGIVVDSDIEGHGGGQEHTLAQVARIAADAGFSNRRRVGEQGGFLFCHDDGFKPIGVWIMPDNVNNGVIEHFIKSSIREEQKIRFENGLHALECSVLPFLFPTHRRIKAEIATWLAWQEDPGAGIYSCVRDDLIDFSSNVPAALLAWLEKLYSE